MRKLPGKHMKLGLSDGYKIVKILDKRRINPVLNHSRVDTDIAEEDKDVGNALHQFQKYAAEVLDYLNQNLDDDLLKEKIMILRMHAMRIEAGFDDFVDALDAVIKKSDKDSH